MYVFCKDVLYLSTASRVLTHVHDSDIDVSEFLWLDVAVRAVEGQPGGQLPSLQDVQLEGKWEQ